MVTSPLYQIMLIDDHPLILKGLSTLLNQHPSFEVIQIAKTCTEALEILESATPDLVLLDIHLPDGNGFEITQQIKLRWPQRKILLMSAQNEDVCVGWSLQFGAEGMFNKGIEPQEMYTLIFKAINGELALRQQSYYWGMKSLRGELSQGFNRLSKREFSVFFQIGCGKNTKEIANELEISSRTVETYHRNIRQKLAIPHHDALIHLATLVFSDQSTKSVITYEQNLITAFQNRTLSQEEWTHEVHLIVSFHYLSRYTFETALAHIKEGIIKLNRSHQNEMGYHETITYAYAHLIHNHLVKAPIWLHCRSFLDAFPHFIASSSLTPLLEYYTEDLLTSAQARKAFVEPDLKALPIPDSVQ